MTHKSLWALISENHDWLFRVWSMRALTADGLKWYAFSIDKHSFGGGSTCWIAGSICDSQVMELSFFLFQIKIVSLPFSSFLPAIFCHIKRVINSARWRHHYWNNLTVAFFYCFCRLKQTNCLNNQKGIYLHDSTEINLLMSVINQCLFFCFMASWPASHERSSLTAALASTSCCWLLSSHVCSRKSQNLHQCYCSSFLFLKSATINYVHIPSNSQAPWWLEVAVRLTFSSQQFSRCSLHCNCLNDWLVEADTVKNVLAPCYMKAIMEVERAFLSSSSL